MTALPSDLEIAQLINGIYGYNGFDTIKWDFFNAGTDANGICYGIKELSGFDVIVFRGSVRFLDWVRDLMAWADPETHEDLGPVHPGFLAGMDATWKAIKPRLANPPIFAGHSLGAARADICSALSILDKVNPARTVVLGEPRPGFEELADILAPYPRASYRSYDAQNEIDLVTTVPLVFPPEEYVHPSPLIDLEVVPDANDTWGAFKLHHSWLYVAGLKALRTAPSS